MSAISSIIVLTIIFICCLFLICFGYMMARQAFAYKIYNDCLDNNRDNYQYLMDIDEIIWKHLFDWNFDTKHWIEKD